MSGNRFRTEQGFTLPEVLISLALISLISLVVMGALGPWVEFKQKLDTERKLQDVKSGIQAVYAARGLAIEDQADGVFAGFVNSVPAAAPSGDLQCAEQLAAFAADASFFSDSAATVAKDGWANPWCIFVSPALSEARDGTTLWYRNIAVVSTGADGRVDPTTELQADGTLVVGGDDFGTLVSGRELQGAKLKETLRRLSRVAQVYEGYFTARFLAAADRDITRYYFADGLASTGSAWSPVATTLNSVGVGNSESVSPWEDPNNTIEVNNFDGVVGTIQARTPATTGTGVLPYTALLRTRIPGPGPLYAAQVVVGAY